MLGFNLLGDGLRDHLDPRLDGPAMSAAAAGEATLTPATEPPRRGLDVRDLGVRVNDTDLVADVRSAIGRGERVGLIGESGSGKSLTGAGR